MSFKTNIVCLATVAFLVLLLDPRFVSSQSTTARTNRVRQALVVRRQRPLTGDTPSSSTANTTTSTSTSEEPEKEEPDESEERQLSKSQSNGRTSRQTEKSLGRKESRRCFKTNDLESWESFPAKAKLMLMMLLLMFQPEMISSLLLEQNHQ